MPKRKSVSKYFVQDCLNIFLLLLTVLKRMEGVPCVKLW